MLSEVLMASDKDISCVANGAGDDRAGVERRFQWRAAA
jgi:hypothetical protein